MILLRGPYNSIIFEHPSDSFKEAIKAAIKSNISFRDLKLTKCDVQNVDFGYQEMKFSAFDFASIINCNFTDSVLYGSYGINGVFLDSCFKRANLYDCNFSESSVVKCNFERVNLEGSTFTNAKLKNCSFYGAYAPFLCFNRAILDNISFKNADLKGVSFFNAKLKNIDFTGANLEHADFRYTGFTREMLKNCKINEYTRFY